MNGLKRDAAPHLELGKRGERLALQYLKSLGYKIAAMNFVSKLGRNRAGGPITGEIDIIAYDGDVLCFIEVKTRSSDEFALPEDAVDRRKQFKIAKTARKYRRLFGLAGEPYRFDVIAVVAKSGRKAEIRLERSFFNEEDLKHKIARFQ